MARRIWQFIKGVAVDIDDQIWNRTGPHGAAEISAGLFNGGASAYVMYGHGGKHDNGPKSQETPEQSRTESAEPEQEQERGGRER